jgi:type IV secretion system protein VirB11
MSVTLDHLLEPISQWLDDTNVEEICIQKPGEAWVYSRGWFERHPVDLDADAIEDIAIVAAAQRRQDIHQRQPLLATDLVGRGRLQAVIYPCVAEGSPSLTIRRGSTEWPTLDELEAGGLFTATKAVKSATYDDELIQLYQGGHWKRFLAGAVLKRKTMIICGTNASGKTHISKAALGAVPAEERLITIEDAPELRGLDRLHPNSVSLYYDKDGKGGVTASVLVEAALRMRIGRLFLQEIRDGVGAIAFLLALQTGHTGGITTIHASDCLAVFDRLRVLVKQAPGGASISDTDMTKQLRSLVDVIVHAGRDGSTFKVDEVWFRACPDVMGKSDERGVAAFSGESGAVAGNRAGVCEPCPVPQP